MADRQKILIVDDRPENLISLEKVLAGTDAEVIRAESGNEALRLALYHNFAVAILDVQMPGMDGYELAEFLRSDQKNRQLPIIFLTAFHSDDQQIFKGYAVGAVDFITKPYNAKILLAKVRIFLQLDRQKKLLEEKLELERSKKYLENILSAISDAVIVVDRDGRIQKVNQAAERLIGVPADKLIGEVIEDYIEKKKSEDETDFHFGRPFSRENLIPFSNKECMLLNHSGEKILISLSLSVFYNEADDIFAAVFVASDIRQLKKEEENRIHLEKMRALGTLTAGVAHELNNPMMGIVGFAEYCRKHTEAEDKRYEILNDIVRETKRCIDIVQNLLTFSRRGKNAQKERELVPLDVIMDRVFKLLSYRIEKEKVSLDCRYADPCPAVFVDAEGIQQVLLNLVINALDAMEGREDRKLQIEIAVEDNQAAVKITDNGQGIDPEDTPYIFDPFYTTKPPAKGTGLGLSSSLSIVRAHEGDIQYSSDLAIGTSFTVYLPVSS